MYSFYPAPILLLFPLVLLLFPTHHFCLHDRSELVRNIPGFKRFHFVMRFHFFFHGLCHMYLVWLGRWNCPNSIETGQTRADTHTQKGDTTHVIENDTPVQCSTHWWQMSVIYSGMCVDSYHTISINSGHNVPFLDCQKIKMWCVTAKLAIEKKFCG